MRHRAQHYPGIVFENAKASGYDCTMSSTKGKTNTASRVWKGRREDRAVSVATENAASRRRRQQVACISRGTRIRILIYHMVNLVGEDSSEADSGYTQRRNSATEFTTPLAQGYNIG